MMRKRPVTGNLVPMSDLEALAEAASRRRTTNPPVAIDYGGVRHPAAKQPASGAVGVARATWLLVAAVVMAVGWVTAVLGLWQAAGGLVVMSGGVPTPRPNDPLVKLLGRVDLLVGLLVGCAGLVTTVAGRFLWHRERAPAKLPSPPDR